MNLTRLLLITAVLLSMMLAANNQPEMRGKRSEPIGIGDTVPDFTLADQNGHKITLSDARGKSPVVLVFYRGYW